MLARGSRLLLTPLLLVVVPVVGALIAWPLLALMLVLDAIWSPIAAMRRRSWQARDRCVDSASIITVSWNGRHFLETLLPSLQRACEEHGGDHEVIVVDNGSTDGTVAWLQACYPWVKVVALPENRFFVRGNRAGVEAATRDVLVFVNNDMEVRPGFLGPLLDGLRDPRVFGVTAEIFFRDEGKRREETGRTRADFRHGSLKLAHVQPLWDETKLDYVPTFWAGGGSAAFDRAMYLELGGFDTLYDPFYMEDTGLSYQAWKRGWRVLFTARSAVLHEHRGTSRRAFGDEHIDNVIRRNHHLFLWRNISDPAWLARSLLLLPCNMLVAARRFRGQLARGLWFELRALLRAVPRAPEAVCKRLGSRIHDVVGDREVFDRANSIVAHRRACRTELGNLPVPGGSGRKILVLSARLPRLGHDGSWVLYRRLEAMARQHRVTLFAFLDHQDEDVLAEPLREQGIEVVTLVRDTNRYPGNLHHAVPQRLWRDYSSPAMRGAVARMLEGTDYDLVQVEYVEMAHLVADLKKSAPWIYVCHESIALAASREQSVPSRWRQLQAQRYEQRLVSKFDAVAALSSRDAASLAPAARDVTVIPSGITVTEVVPTQAVDPATIVFVGYYDHAPNVDAAEWLVDEILPKLRQRVPGVRVRLVGGSVPARVVALGDRESVEPVGYVEDLDAELARATVVALPLRAGGGLRGKVLEAWANSKAIVATSVALEGLDAQGDTHCLVADDGDAFADQVVRLIQDTDLRQKLGEAGNELVRTRYSLDAAMAGFDGIYERMSRVQK
jgi:GT2 family glycosyltransferase/glycosyltransferase involved in cell wall biosynthesis